MTAISRYFPPQILRHINFFNVRSPTEAAVRMRAVQRVTAAALGAYLFVRYQPVLEAKLANIPDPQLVVKLVAAVVGYCLSAPATMLAAGGYGIYKGTVLVLSSADEKNIVKLVGGLFWFTGGYFYCHNYATPTPSFNFLDKLFVATAGRFAEPIYRRFYSK